MEEYEGRVNQDNRLREAFLLSMEMYRKLRRISRSVEMIRGRYASEVQLSAAEMYVLRNLQSAPKSTYSELADYSGIARNTLSALSKSLLSQGYIEQHPDPNDGRFTHLSVTQSGEEVLASVEARIIATIGPGLLELEKLLLCPDEVNLLDQLKEIDQRLQMVR